MARVWQLRPTLRGDIVVLEPLEERHFEPLLAAGQSPTTRSTRSLIAPVRTTPRGSRPVRRAARVGADSAIRSEPGPSGTGSRASRSAAASPMPRSPSA
jgi:hypothetical protein